jgi:hypothetical protein
LREFPTGGSNLASVAAGAIRATASDQTHTMKSRFERGAVVRCQDQAWIVWTYPRGRFADPLVLPVAVQNAPLHRSHVRLLDASLGLGDRVLIVRTLDAQSVPGAECVLIGQCSDLNIAALDRTMRRAIEAQAHEQSAPVATTF